MPNRLALSPWTVVDAEYPSAPLGDLTVKASDGSIVCDVPGGPDAAAVARALGALPELLAACQAVDALAEAFLAEPPGVTGLAERSLRKACSVMFRDKVAAALAKATGAAPDTPEGDTCYLCGKPCAPEENRLHSACADAENARSQA